MVPSLDILCEKDGEAEIHYCVLIPDKNKDVFKVTPANVINADVVSAYDASWTWLPPSNITVVSNSEDLNSNDESVNLAVGGNVPNLPAAMKKKTSEKKILVTSDYKIATRISVLNEAPLKAR